MCHTPCSVTVHIFVVENCVYVSVQSDNIVVDYRCNLWISFVIPLSVNLVLFQCDADLESELLYEE